MIREYTEADKSRLIELHREQGIDYPLNLDNPLLDIKLVAEDRGVVRQALLARVTCECYLLMDRIAGTPQDRLELFTSLHNSALERGWVRGFEDAHIWIPPRLEKGFGRRLMKMGWTKPEWPCYTRVLEGPNG